ncbi:glycosyltransferase involved in cell wall biosynthesis [Sphingomonas jinjuensis]|uniref:Glycosyltransferase involved in cell wall biosynthesis n=1 Tax=Sphingomonas jinjuensis TaxID=535907 RepID=A0A840FIV0_9SPHN|nr:glycosyltransferase [Sphingomonas jinjuensis]MBB4153888.1 glycosyltransferase involved in cell wall biosynthesis [Sphingomonas jinjuensis]
MTQDRFVCAINRNRDGYQVPLALYEAGLLERFVTDFYAPDAPPGWLPAPLRRRRIDGLPHAATTSALASFGVQAAAELLGAPMAPVFRHTDRMLGHVAGRVARSTRSHLYCYSPYLPADCQIAPGTRRAIFEFHPLPGLLWELLAADHARYPDATRQSYQQEAAIKRDDAEHDVWRRADAVSCASSITRRSLEYAGCDPSIITVVPYAFDALPLADPSPPVASERAQAEFLFVGQGVQRKGLHHLIDAWQRADLPDARLTLVCYRIDPGIRAMVKSPSIRLLGRQERADLDALYAASDVFVMPSLVEGFGLVYLEALSRGCHAVATENTGLPDLDLSAGAATIVPSGDIDLLAAALARLSAAAQAGELDRTAIRDEAARWQWRDFRAAIAAHARSILT